MNFLFDRDYKKQIKSEIKAIITGGDSGTVEDSEEAAQIIMSGYLMAKFNLALVFIRMYKWDATTAYANGSQIYLTAPAYNNTTAYVTGNLVSSGGKLYKAKTGSTGVVVTDTTKWDYLTPDFSKYYAIADNIPAGTLPTDTDNFTLGDLRHPVIMQKMIDIVIYDLHSSVSGHQIPEIREKRFEMAIKWLEEIRDGVLQDPFLVVKTDTDGATTGTFIKYGSQTKQDWSY